MVRPGWRRGRLIGVMAVTLALSVGTACAGSSARWRAPGGAAGPTAPAANPSMLVVSHAADATDISPAEPVSVSLTNGTLESVTLTNPQGKVVKGEFDAVKSAWTNSEDLGYAKTYTLVTVGTGVDGIRYEDRRSFSTVKPNNYTLPYLRANVATLLDGGTFGVAQPVVVWFDEQIKDKAAAERALTVTTDPPGIVGGWYWLDAREVHYRPKEYWPAGTKVTVEANVYGKHLGGGLYGQEDRKASFTIGDSHIAIADSATKRMKVYINGVQITKINGRDVTLGIPISMGKGGTEVGANGAVVDYWTRSGPHVVTTKHEVYRMTSASFGITDPTSPNYYDVKIKKSIRISGAGEFVHLADWNIPAHGKANTSHGCINVAPAYIYWFFDTFRAGDVVDVKNTPKKLPLRDGLGDWTLSWEKWLEGSALS